MHCSMHLCGKYVGLSLASAVNGCSISVSVLAGWHKATSYSIIVILPHMLHDT